MILAVRRALAGAVLGVALSCGVLPAAGALAASPSPTPSATATATGTGAPTSEVTPSTESGVADGPDAALDNSRTTWAVGAAGVLALLSALAVFLRRR